MWISYTTTPIITVFHHEEKKLNQIPFPSVTICSVNKLRKNIWEEHRANANRAVKGEFSNETMLKIFASVYDVYHICHATGTFTDKFRYMTPDAPELWNPMKEKWGQFTEFMDTLGTLGNVCF